MMVSITMIRLMCSKNRQELETLGSKLHGDGIRYEIRGNPLATALGIARFEIYVQEGDLSAASQVCQGLAAEGGEEDAMGDLLGSRRFNGFVQPAQSDAVIEAQVIPDPTTGPAPNNGSERQPETGSNESKTDLARATALLEEEVEALLARETELVNRCSSLEEKVKGLDEALAHTRADLAREVSNRSGAEMKLAGVGEARASLEKEKHALELRLKASGQALATAQGQLESEARQREQLMKERSEGHVQTQSYVGTVNDLRSQIRARLAAREKPGSSPPEQRARRLPAEKERTKSGHRKG